MMVMTEIKENTYFYLKPIIVYISIDVLYNALHEFDYWNGSFSIYGRNEGCINSN